MEKLGNCVNGLEHHLHKKQEKTWRGLSDLNKREQDRLSFPPNKETRVAGILLKAMVRLTIQPIKKTLE